MSVKETKPCPGSGIRSNQKGKLLGTGKEKGPIGSPSDLEKDKKLGLLMCGTITRLLKNIRGLKGNVYVVGGIVTEGATLRDIDIVVTKEIDIAKIKKALGKYASRVHFLFQKSKSTAPIFIQVTGKEPRSPDEPSKKGRVPQNEYAN